ncbi:GtrA family protein [Natrialba aegyptia DSM 13077]|uniref:GtrA family protein n=2 Tax=Natrialba aegyptia TaxID=129789 RepID=M0BA97_9EURY|nr:GtrA family protein [Natrialba aegyptia DSM 13077]
MSAERNRNWYSTMIDSFAETIRTRLRALLSARRFRQFAGVGLVGATVDIGTLILLVEAMEVSAVPGKALSWELSIVVIFVLNEWWTFASHGKMHLRALGTRFLRSNGVRFLGFLVTLGVFTLLVESAGLWYGVANVLGIGVGFFVNYTCESLYTWQVHRDER